MPQVNGSDESFSHQAFGHRILANHPIPEIGRPSVHPDERREANRLGTVCLEFEKTPDVVRDGKAPYWADAGADRLRFVYPGFAELWINEKGIRTRYAPNDTFARVLALVTGVGVGSLWHLRGHLVLHASAVSFGSRTVAFLGPTGSGKSTLSAELTLRGATFYTDDLLLIPEETLRDDGEPPVAVPQGRGTVRLEQAPGPDFTDAWTPISGSDRSKKRFFRYDDRPGSSWTDLAAVCVLEKRDTVGSTRLTGAEGVMALVGNSYAADVLSATDRTKRHLNRCARLASRTDIYRLARPMDGRAETTRELLDHVRDLI